MPPYLGGANDLSSRIGKHLLQSLAFDLNVGFASLNAIDQAMVLFFGFEVCYTTGMQ